MKASTALELSPEWERNNGPAIDAIVEAFVTILRRAPRHEFDAIVDKACRLTAELEGWTYTPENLTRETFLARRVEAIERFDARLETLRRKRAGGVA